MLSTKIQTGSVASSNFIIGCHQCFATDKKLSRCAQCHIAKYCSKKCQQAAWPEHKKECVKKVEAEKKVPTEVQSGLKQTYTLDKGQRDRGIYNLVEKHLNSGNYSDTL